MKKELSLVLLVFSFIFISGCAIEEIQEAEELPQPIAEESEEIETQEEISEETEAIGEEPITLPVEPGSLVHDVKEPEFEIFDPKLTYPDAFDGTSINTEKYSIKLTGNGSLKQDNEIVMTGDAEKELIWIVLYTTKEIDFSKDFTVEVDLNMTSDVERGDAMAIMAIEKREEAELGKMPKYDYCEVSSSPSHGNIIRMQTSGHGSQIPETAGKFTMTFNALKEKLICGIGNDEITENQKGQRSAGFVLTLRAGLHTISAGEGPGTGSFTVRYDNLNLIQGSDKK